MKNVTENELLSAYLDGELTAEERAEVEHLLAESQEARQLLDQLRTLGATLRSMPQHKLDEDLSGRVLRLAERQVLAGKPPLAQPAGLGWAATLRRFLTPRALAWSGLAVAVAVMLTVFDRGELRREADKKIAMAPPKVTLERKTGVAEQTDEPLSIRPLEEDWGSVEDRLEAEYPVRAKEKAIKTDEHRAESAGVAGAKRSDAPDHPGRRSAMPRPPTAVDPTTDGMAAESSLMPKSGKKRLLKTAPIPPGGAVLTDLTDGKPGGKKSSLSAGQGGVLLVQCDVSPQAVKDQAFDKLLVSNNIAWEKKDRTQTAALDVIYVEATPAQIEAAISQLAAQPEQFLSVSVEPAPGEVSQQNLSRFNRSKGRQQSPPRLKRRAGSAQMKQSLVEQDQLRRTAPKCQTLFILRVVDIQQD